jgi:hypothetical protein
MKNKNKNVNEGIADYRNIGGYDVDGLSSDEVIAKLTADSNVWQFNGVLINTETGEPASAEESAAFEERQSIRANLALRATERIVKVNKEWKKKYGKKIKKFFQLDRDEECYDSERLVYALSTRIFDIVAFRDYYADGSGGYISRDEHVIKTYDAFMEYVDSSSSSLKDEIYNIKDIFPEQFRDAVEGFIDGSHDT